MAFVHGRFADIVAGSTRVSTIFRSANFSVDVDTAETSTFLQSYKTHIAGQGGGTLELEGLYDTVLSSVPRATFFVENQVVTIGPAGLAVGDLARLILTDTVNYTESSSVGDAVLANWSLQSDGEVGFGSVLRGAGDAAVTATGNGTTVDYGAAVTAAVWALHVHVTAASGTTPTLVVKIQDSADGSDWADVAGVTTGTLTTATSVRVTGTNTIRRFVRAVHTVGGTTPSFTFTAAFSRRTP